MNENEWLLCRIPAPMLDHLGTRVSERKLRLFAVACCRRIWDKFIHKPPRTAVEVSERFADGLATRKALRYAFNAACRAVSRTMRYDKPEQRYAAAEAARLTSYGANLPTVVAGIAARTARASDSREAEQLVQAGFLREIFGNPFRPANLGDDVRTWRSGLLFLMAHRIYDEQDYQDLPFLADGLEEAGCTDDALLTHLRLPGNHLRGCWAIDLILEKSDGPMHLQYRHR